MLLKRKVKARYFTGQTKKMKASLKKQFFPFFFFFSFFLFTDFINLLKLRAAYSPSTNSRWENENITTAGNKRLLLIELQVLQTRQAALWIPEGSRVKTNGLIKGGKMESKTTGYEGRLTLGTLAVSSNQVIERSQLTKTDKQTSKKSNAKKEREWSRRK